MPFVFAGIDLEVDTLDELLVARNPVGVFTLFCDPARVLLLLTTV
jgi:hypothetical protein